MHVRILLLYLRLGPFQPRVTLCLGQREIIRIFYMLVKSIVYICTLELQRGVGLV
jgi:hypothetical protein